MGMNKTGIEWCDATWNPFIGCSKISEGCEHCYAERRAWMLSRNPNVPAATREKYQMVVRDGKWTGEVVFFPERLWAPRKVKKPKRIFVGSMTDIFHNNADFMDLIRVFGVMNDCKQHTFLLLTKRPENMVTFCYEAGLFPSGLPSPACETPSGCTWPENVWPGVTVENQRQEERIRDLLRVPAARHVVSIEPMLGPINGLAKWFGPQNEGQWLNVVECGHQDTYGLNWVIVGGESGPNAQPVHPDWVRSLRDQCAAAGVAFNFQGWGSWAQSQFSSYGKFDQSKAGGFQVANIVCSTDKKLRGQKRYYPIPKNYNGEVIDIKPMKRVRKTRSGRQLDGEEYNEWP